MKRTIGALILIGLVAVFWAIWPRKATETVNQPSRVETTAQSPKQNDNRITLLDNFFAKYKCPKPYYSHDYIASADEYNIPYTLLPAISILESTCGRHQKFNNWWGYWSDTKGFESVPIGIDYIDSQLSSGQHYAGKTFEQKLHAYNSVNPKYYSEIIRLMDEIQK